MSRATKAELLDEIAMLRARVSELETACAGTDPARAGRDPGQARQSSALIAYDHPDEIATLATLRQNEMLFHRAATIARLGAWVWDEVEDRLEYCSDELAQIFGFTIDEYIPRFADGSQDDNMFAEDRERYDREIKKAVVEMQPYAIEFRECTASGEARYYCEHGEPVLDDDGRLIKSVGIIQDITEYKAAQESLRKSEALLRHAAKMAKMGHWVWDDIHDRIESFSEELPEIFECTAEEYLSAFVNGDQAVKVHPDDRERYLQEMQRVSNDPQPYMIEYRVRLPSGAYRFYRESGEPVLDDTGRLIKTSGIVQDITDVREAIDSLRQSERNFRALVEGSIQGIVIHRGMRPLFANEACARIMGFETVDDILSVEDLTEFVHPEEREQLKQRLAARARHEQVESRNVVRYLRRDGSTIWLENFVTIVDWENEPAILATFVDVTERKLSEEALLRAHEELEERVRSRTAELETINAALQREIRERRQTDERLTASEERLRQACRLAGLGHYVWDSVDDRCLVCSEELARIHATTPESFMARASGITGDFSLTHPQDRELYANAIAGLRRNGKGFELEYRSVTADGDVRHVHEIVRPVLDAKGKVILELGVVQDITERKRAEVELRRQEKQLREVLDIAKMGYWAWDPATDRLSIPPETARILGRDAAVPGSMQLDEYMTRYVHPDDLEWVRNETYLPQEPGRRYQAEYRVVTETGDVKWLVDVGETVFDEAGNFVGEVGAVQDITERKRTEEALRKQDERLKETLEVAKLGYWQWDPESNQLTLPAVLSRILGRPQGAPDTIDYDLYHEQYVHPDDAEWVGKTMRLPEEPGIRRQAEYRLVSHDGEELWVYDIADTVADDNGKFLGEVGTVQDITDRKRAEQAIQQSEARLSKALRQSKLAHWTFDFAKHQITEWSDEAAHILGIEPADLPARYEDYLAWVHPDDRAKVEACYAAEDPDNPVRRDYQVEYRMLRRDGATQWLSEMGEVEVDATGTPVAFTGAIQDITDRKLSEIALRESEERFRSVVDNSPSAIYLKDRAGRYQMANRQFERWYGIAAQDAIGKTTLDLFPPELAQQYTAMDQEVMETGRTCIREVDAPFGDGSLRTVLATKFPIASPDGGISGIGTINMDITENKRAEAALNEQRQLLETILGAADIAISVKDKDFRLVFVNAYHANFSGLRPEQMIGKTPSQATDETYGAYVRNLDQRAIDSDLPLVRFEHKSKDWQGKEHSWLTTKAVIREETGDLRYIVSASVDLTDLKAREEELKQSQKMDALGKLTSGIAHDFNNLLLLINANLIALQKDTVSQDDIRKAVESIKLATQTGNNLTSSLMAFSRDQPLMPEVVDLPGAIEHTVQSLFRTLATQMTIETNYSGDIAPVLIDGQYLENALLNLALNARDAMNGAGVLTIAVENYDRSSANPVAALQHGEFVKVSVADNGEGMTPEVLDQALQPFFTTKSAGSGTGLGLSMVYRFVKQSGGHIEIESRRGQGTTVSMYLPRAGGGQRPIADRDSDTQSVALDHATILVTEDDEPVRRATVKLLQQHGVRTFEAASADEAMTVLAAEPTIDLLFSDVNLKGSISGFELAAKAKELRPDLKVAFCSGDASRPDPNSTIAGAPLLRKPYAPDDLRRTVAQVLSAGNVGVRPLN